MEILRKTTQRNVFAQGADRYMLYTFRSIHQTSESRTLDLVGLQIGLEKLSGVRVHLLTPMSLPDKFPDKVLAEAQLV